MSLLSDIVGYLTDAGHIGTDGDGFTWRTPSRGGFEDRTILGNDTVIMLEDLPGAGPPTHDDGMDELAFRILVRHKQHYYDACRTKWAAVFADLQNQVTAINAYTASISPVGSQYALIRADQGGPAVTYDEKDRPHMSAVFRVLRIL